MQQSGKLDYEKKNRGEETNSIMKKYMGRRKKV